jgi:hypothetical protein
MIDSKAAARYPGFAGIEYAHVRRVAFPAFEWRGRVPARPAGVLAGPRRRSIVPRDPPDAEESRLAHVGYDVPRARKDADVVFPLALLRELVAGDKGGQRQVIERCLREATRARPPGTIVDLGFDWPDDLRQRQLRKEAH